MIEPSSLMLALDEMIKAIGFPRGIVGLIELAQRLEVAEEEARSGPPNGQLQFLEKNGRDPLTAAVLYSVLRPLAADYVRQEADARKVKSLLTRLRKTKVKAPARSDLLFLYENLYTFRRYIGDDALFDRVHSALYAALRPSAGPPRGEMAILRESANIILKNFPPSLGPVIGIETANHELLMHLRDDGRKATRDPHRYFFTDAASLATAAEYGLEGFDPRTAIERYERDVAAHGR